MGGVGIVLLCLVVRAAVGLDTLPDKLISSSADYYSSNKMPAAGGKPETKSEVSGMALK